MRVSEHANYLLNEYGRLQFDYAAYCKPYGESLRNEARNNLEEYIAGLEAAQRWIPVSERPDPLGWVIGMDNRREVYPCVYEDGQWLNDVQDELPTGCKITHWQPLPEALKEVKNE